MAAGKLKIDIRRNRILEILRRDGRVLVSQLSEELNATPVTIRNDLDALGRDGYLERVQGGAVQKLRPPRSWGAQPAPQDGLAAVKQAIAAAAADRIRDGETLFINSGTTTLCLAAALAQHRNLNIVTNSIALAMELSAVASLRVLLLGGELNTQYAFTYGGDAQEQLGRYQADWAILSVDGVSADGGVTTYHAEEAIIDRMMVGRARKTMIVADHTKIGRDGFSHICPIDSVHLLVTDPQCSRDAAARLGERGPEVLFG